MLLLARHYFREHLRQTQHVAWAVRCATLSLMVQSSAAAVMNEFRHHENLFCLHLRLFAHLNRIGYDRLVGLGPGYEIHLSTPAMSIPKVKWNLVAPIATNVPKRAAHGTLLLTSGDTVSWASNRGLDGDLSAIPQLTHIGEDPVSLGEPMVGNLESRGGREPDSGFSLRIPNWDGFEVLAMIVRSVSWWEEEAASRHVEYYARRSGWSRRGRLRRQRHPRRTTRPQDARENSTTVLESPPSSPRAIQKPMNNPYRTNNRENHYVSGAGHNQQPVSKNHTENSSIVRAEKIRVPGNPAKCLIESGH